MVRIRQGWLVAVIGLALPLATACKKDDKTADTAGGDKSGKTGPAEKPASAADDLSLLPVDSEMVVGINFSQVQGSELWKKFVEPKLLSGEIGKKIGEFKTKCGFDPMASVKSVSTGMKVSSGKGEGAVVVHGVDKSKAWQCLDNMKDEMTKDGTEYTRDGDVGVFKDKTGTASALTFINDSTALMVIGENANAATAKAAASGGSALKTSAAFVDMYSKVKTSDSVWFLLNGKLFEKGAPMGMKFKAMFGSVNVTDGLSMDVRMRLDSPEAATQFAGMAKAQAQSAAKMFDQVDVTNDDAEVKVTVVMTKQKLEGLIAQIGPMLGALGGGLGGP